MKRILLAVMLFLAACSADKNRAILTEDTIDLTSAKGFEILCLEDFSATPDENGDLKSYDVIFPGITQMIYYGCDERFPAVAPNNKTQTWVLDSNYKMLNAPDTSKEAVKGSYTKGAQADGTYSILKLASGEYMVLLPLVGEQTMSRFTYEEGQNPKLTLFSWGTNSVDNQQAPILAYAVCGNLYEANYKVWSEVLNSGLKGVTGALRSTKEYPEHFNYLGWCSWEEYKTVISEGVLSKAISNINNSYIPVRWVLIDDGTQALTDRKLSSFEPNTTKFPNGFEPITKLRSDDGIKWMGIWHYQAGYGAGLHTQNDMGEEFNTEVLKTLKNGSYRAKEDYASQKRFLERLLKPSIDAGFDFVKIDFQGVQFDIYRGNDNAVAAHLNTVRAQEDICYENNLKLLNCMSQDLISAMNTKHSVVVRSSQDYYKGVATGARIQTYQCFNNSLFLGQSSYVDHDMFHSSDEECNLMMSYSKSMSCGPVYLSDAPEHFEAEYITPLCYEDGELLKTLAPAVPLVESIFTCPINTRSLYKVIAPLSNGAAAMVCYNINDDGGDIEISGAISPSDYKSASAMLQPYEGEWEIPAEGLILYDLSSRKAVEFKQDYNVSLTGISANMFNLCPIRSGWAVIGDTSKYLAPETAKDVKVSSQSLTFTPQTNGEYLFWVKSGKPYCGTKACESKGDGLYSVKANKGQDVVISLK